MSAKVPVTLRINGESHTHEVEPRLLLVHFIRDYAGLTGTHVGCDTSQCGACTVSVDGVALKSCTRFAVQAEGSEITTVEGLVAPDGSLNPVQDAFSEHHGLQCGFCTPGMIMAAYCFLKRNPDPGEDDIRHGLEGNLCRCTGYENIVKAVKAAAPQIAAAKD